HGRCSELTWHGRYGSPAMRLMRRKKTIALILDEIQRCPIETYVALASHNKAAVAVGDRGQDIYPFFNV
ncbi:MAG: hypothetical protein ACKPKO_57195, partial [Candidatus Fonsibacter sp.]